MRRRELQAIAKLTISPLTISPLATPEHYDLLLARCRQLFLAKTHDYGTAWRILRLPSVTDQLFTGDRVLSRL